MKTCRTLLLFLLAGVALAAAETPSPAARRVGVYDSRLVAYAHFWSSPSQQQLRQQRQDALAARRRGDEAGFEELERSIKATQGRLALQVFSTAPIPEALAALDGRLPVLTHAAGVSRLVSRWDTEALRGVAAADQVDVTDQLVAEFSLPAERAATLAQLRAAEPLPRWRAKILNFFNRL